MTCVVGELSFKGGNKRTTVVSGTNDNQTPRILEMGKNNAFCVLCSDSYYSQIYGNPDDQLELVYHLEAFSNLTNETWKAF